MSLPSASAVVEVLKPITWFPPMWAFGCGVVASGVDAGPHWPLIVLGIVLAGPLVCATSQVVNDWFDRDVDAINEPNRPIPSGRIPGRWGLYIGLAWTALSLAVASRLGPWGFGAGALGLALAWAYSAPPIRLKQNGWFGNTACAFSYEGLAWITGSAVMINGAMPDVRSLALAVIYSIGAHGIMTLNDFKSVVGDRQMGIASLPVQLGIGGAARTACAFMAASQLLVVALLVSWDRIAYAAVIGVLLIVQIAMMKRFLAAPVERATWYSGLGVTLYVIGMLISAFAARGVIGDS